MGRDQVGDRAEGDAGDHQVLPDAQAAKRWWALIVAVLVAAGAVIAVPAFRLTGIY